MRMKYSTKHAEPLLIILPHSSLFFTRNKQLTHISYNTINVQVYQHNNMNLDAKGGGAEGGLRGIPVSSRWYTCVSLGNMSKKTTK